MRRVNGIISRGRWQQDATASIVATFHLTDVGRAVSAMLLGRLIVLAACLRTSLSAVAARSRRSPSDETVRKALLANLPKDVAELERRINDSLPRWTPKAFFKRPRCLALDLHHRPYYGERCIFRSVAASRSRAHAGSGRGPPPPWSSTGSAGLSP